MQGLSPLSTLSLSLAPTPARHFHESGLGIHVRAVQLALLALVPQLVALRVPDLPVLGLGLLTGGGGWGRGRDGV